MASAVSLPQLLLGCLHLSSMCSKPRDTLDALYIIERLLSNRLHCFDELRYGSFSATSPAWIAKVQPHVYLLRLAAWMECQLDAEGSRYLFVGGGTTNADPTRDPGEMRQQRQQHLRILADRLDELQCVVSSWNAPEVHEGNDTVATSSCHPHWTRAQDALVSLFRGKPPDSHDETWYTSNVHCLLLRRLLMCGKAMTAPAHARTHMGDGEGSVGWSETECTTSWRERARSWMDHQHTRKGEHGQCASLAAGLSNDASIQWMLSHASLCKIVSTCTQAATISDRFKGGGGARTGPSSPLTTRSLHDDNAVAQRLRRHAEQEQYQRYLGTTGPKYRKLSHEERSRGESIIVDIAGLLEQISTLKESQGMVRHDRLEARKLLNAFKQCGDLLQLYELQDAYTRELEETKRHYGKPLVYTALP